MWLHLTTIFISCFVLHNVNGILVNITIDDTDPSILYQPSTSWHASSAVCPVCLNPDTRNALLGTYHDGTNIPANMDADDLLKNNSRKGKGKEKGDGDDDQPGARHEIQGLASSTLQQRTDADDSGPVGSSVTARFQFTGKLSLHDRQELTDCRWSPIRFCSVPLLHPTAWYSSC